MPKTIIRVVEDDPSVRNGLEYLLMSEGYESELYKSAEAFLAGDAAVSYTHLTLPTKA